MLITQARLSQTSPLVAPTRERELLDPLLRYLFNTEREYLGPYYTY